MTTQTNHTDITDCQTLLMTLTGDCECYFGEGDMTCLTCGQWYEECKCCKGDGKVLKYPGLSVECMCIQNGGVHTIVHMRGCDRRTGRIPNFTLEGVLGVVRDGDNYEHWITVISAIAGASSNWLEAATRALCEAEGGEHERLVREE